MIANGAQLLSTIADEVFELHDRRLSGSAAELKGVCWLRGRLLWVFPKIGVPQNGWFIMEHLLKMDDLGVPLFSETSICK